MRGRGKGGRLLLSGILGVIIFVVRDIHAKPSDAISVALAREEITARVSRQ